MVKASTVQQSNAEFTRAHHGGFVCVFAGATSGIGAGTLERIVQMLGQSTFYVLGRSEARFASQRATLESLNPSCRIVFLEVDVSLISGIDTACKQITAAEKKVDYLFMSAGAVPYAGAQYTKEGVELCFMLSYYSRIRLIVNLLPLLRQSSHPRVLSVLNGGREKPLCEDDLGLEHQWSDKQVINQTTTMMSLALEHLAENNKKIIFLHAFPGLVRTEIFAKLKAPESAGIMKRISLALFCGLIAILMRLLGASPEESGERQAFHLTSDDYTVGAWRVDNHSEIVTAPGVLEQYSEQGWAEKVWEHTLGVFEKALN